MSKLVFALALSALSFAAHADDQNVANFYTIGNVSIHEEVPTSEEIYLGNDILNNQASVTAAPSLQAFNLVDVGATLDQLILIGGKVVNIIKQGAPSVDIKRDAVHVVPKGVQDWQQLGGWQVPTTKVFSLSFTNLFNMEVVSVRLKMSGTWGGSYNGRGRYLSNVYIVPTNVWALWGFNVNVWMENHDPVNVGSKQNPVAGLGVDLRYSVNSVLPITTQTGAQDYFFAGDGRLLQLR